MNKDKKCIVLLKEDILDILNKLYNEEEQPTNAKNCLEVAIYQIENIEYDLKELFKDADPATDNLLVTSVKKRRVINDRQEYKKALIRLSYAPAFPAMQTYFLKWVQWVKKKGKQLNRERLLKNKDNE